MGEVFVIHLRCLRPHQHGTNAEEIQKYTYDSLDRLTKWTQNNGSDATSYTYDAVGNRTKMEESFTAFADNYAVTGGKNQLASRSRHSTLYGDTLYNYRYNANGAMEYREMLIDSSTGTWPGRTPTPSKTGLRFKEEDRYSYRGLLNRIFQTDSTNSIMDWRYRYNASGEREQKRLVYTAAWDSVVGYPWMYYLLGGSNEQLAVYHGQQRSGTGLCGDTGRRVYMYPAEYLTHGIGYTGVQEDVSQVITDASGNKQFRISDHLASLRVTLDATGTSHDDFDPWGNLLPKGATLASRRGYNDREKDRETGRLNLGVRSFGDGDHFTSIDPLWEKFPSQSPYLYANANPLRFTDPNGKQAMPKVAHYITVWNPGLGAGGSGAGGVAPLVAVGGLIKLAIDHPEQSAPFMVGMMNDISQSIYNPIGFGINTIGGMIVASQNNTWKDQVEGYVNGTISLHLKKLRGELPVEDYGDPNDPKNQKSWKEDIQRGLDNIKKRLTHLRKPFEQVLRERGWSKERIADMVKQIEDEGFEIPKIEK